MDYKKLSIVLTALVMVFGTTSAFAIWDILTATESSNTVQIGTGLSLTTTADVSVNDWLNGGQLVPSSAVLQDGDVNEISNTFDVDFSGDLIAGMELDVNYTNLLIGGSSDYIALVNIEYYWDYDVNGSFNDAFDYLTNTLAHDDSSPYSLPDFYDAGNDVTRTVIYVKVFVSLLLPSTSSEYAGVQNQNITFDLHFEAKPA